MAESPTNGVIRFGIFEVDIRAGELRRKGVKVRLQEQPFQVLAMLLERPGELVTREELRSRLWPADTFVDFDHGLNAAVKRLRDALGDSADSPRFVETLARRGYRFLAPANVGGRGGITGAEPSSATIPKRSRRWWIAVAAGIVLLDLAGISAGWHAGHRSAASMRLTERRLTGNPENDPVTSAAISPDGKYLAFADKEGLFLRAVGTGETHPVVLPGEGTTQFVSWFPDGSHVLATRTVNAAEKPGLWNVSVFGGAPRKLVDAAERGAVSPDGSHIIFVRGDYGHEEIWEMRSAGEEARKVLGQPGDNFEPVVWSADGKRIAFIRSAYHFGWEESDVSLGILDLANGKSKVVLTSSRLGRALAWTPDGRLIYSLSELPPNQNDSNLWAMKIDAQGNHFWGQPVRLTNGPDGKARASVSADGKQLSYLRWMESPSVYISQLEAGGTRLSSPRRLSLDERSNYPFTWTPDGKSVIFTSDRDGRFHLFKQAVDQPAPDLLVGGEQSVMAARLNPEGTEILYATTPAPEDPERQVRLMRLPLAGGTAQLLFAEPQISNFQCAHAPSKVCVLSEFRPDRVDFYTFDSVKGTKKPLREIAAAEWYMLNWSLSPDGSTLALARKQRFPGNANIRLYSLASGKERILALPDWSGIRCLDWSTDGRSLWVSVWAADETQMMLSVDLHGKARQVLQENEKDLGWAIPSPDGRHVAIWEASGSSNAWLLEGF
jgi:Tol biopolymer transport system component/DNA-binding winged helix-turn-helix (wHTH) protein